MNDHLTITLPHPPKALRPNDRTVWQAKLKPKKEARQLAMLATIEAMHAVGDVPPGCTVRGYELLWYYWGAKPDADNALASCKAYLDGIAAALCFNDRDVECVGIRRIHDRRNDLEIIIHYDTQALKLI